MGFFKLSDGSTVGGATEYDSSEGFGVPLPDNTEVLAACTQIEWGSYNDIDNIKSTWTIVAPAEYKDRKIFKTFYINDPKPETADKARKMLAAIDATHGGKIDALDHGPTDEDLGRALISKLMVLKIGLFEKEGEKSRNYIKAVSPRKAGAIAEEAVKKSAKKATPVDDDQDIPF